MIVQTLRTSEFDELANTLREAVPQWFPGYCTPCTPNRSKSNDMLRPRSASS
jgi:hypothetical protein